LQHLLLRDHFREARLGLAAPSFTLMDMPEDPFGQIKLSKVDITFLQCITSC
jgi:hypothetical protein